MRKTSMAIVFAALAAVSLTNIAWAGPFEDFKTQVIAAASQGMDAFAADVGGLLGGTDFSSGRTVGFPGFDVGLAGMVQTKPGSGNIILKNADVDAFGIMLGQASVGIPVVGADVALRGISYSGFSIVGFGARYPVFKSGTLTMFIPDVAVSAYYDLINYTYFSGSHISFDASASFNIPIIKPFVGVGYDKTSLEVKGVSALVNGIEGKSSKTRLTVGAKLIPFPFLYVYGAYTLLHGNTGMNFGLGARF
ncbi:MAG: hypothetical protein KKH28_13725 [Elusimicrobia bacterium]|nr:hypothetical protein [Elusimicrobiota bacterium]